MTNLEKENEALRAQVEKLKVFAVTQDHLRDYSVMDLTPDQCLAEIEAAAVEEFANHCLFNDQHKSAMKWAADRRKEAQK